MRKPNTTLKNLLVCHILLTLTVYLTGWILQDLCFKLPLLNVHAYGFNQQKENYNEVVLSLGKQELWARIAESVLCATFGQILIDLNSQNLW